jgi:hypothetical protein
MVITDKDRRHMNAISPARKMQMMRRMMGGAPTEERHFRGNNNYVKAILKLRASGFRLIDLQRQETAFTAVWYGRNTSMLGRLLSEAMALVVWELDEQHEEVTTLRIWHN